MSVAEKIRKLFQNNSTKIQEAIKLSKNYPKIERKDWSIFHDMGDLQKERERNQISVKTLYSRLSKKHKNDVGKIQKDLIGTVVYLRESMKDYRKSIMDDINKKTLITRKKYQKMGRTSMWDTHYDNYFKFRIQEVYKNFCFIYPIQNTPDILKIFYDEIFVNKTVAENIIKK